MNTGSVGGESGGELVTNGGFTDGSSWTPGFGWTIADGVLKTTIANTASSAQTGVGLVAGVSYPTEFTVKNINGGSIRIQLGTANGTTQNANGTYNENIVAAGSDIVFIDAVDAFQGEIDDVSVTGDMIILK